MRKYPDSEGIIEKYIFLAGKTPNSYDTEASSYFMHPCAVCSEEEEREEAEIYFSWVMQTGGVREGEISE